MDFGLVWGGPTLTMLCIYKQNQRFFIFELVGFRERFWHRKALKITSKLPPKPLKNEVRNEIRNRGGYDREPALDFPASRRVLESQ